MVDERDRCGSSAINVNRLVGEQRRFWRQYCSTP